MNSDMHFLTGGGVGLANYILRNKQISREITFSEALSVFLVSGVAGLVPDFVDPPTNPNHRSIGHSVIGNGILVPKLFDKINNNQNLSESDKIFWQSALLGFISHLALDSTTTAGLPALE
ncbi:MAG: metal-dependent hydrolase [Candidatus Woesearchaeota archaeon]